MKVFRIVRVHSFRNVVLTALVSIAVLIGACHDSVTGPRTQVLVGVWGGETAGLEVTATGGKTTFICGQGTIDEPILIDRVGLFDTGGTFEGKLPLTHPARYTGQVNGNRMIFRVTVAETGYEETFTLTYGVTFPGRTCR